MTTAITTARCDPPGRSGCERRVAPRALLLAVALAMAGPSALAGNPGPAAAAAVAISAGRAELQRCLQIGRARPEETIPALAALLPQLGADPAAEIQAWVALGELHAMVADTAAVEGVVEQLRRRADAGRAGTSATVPSMAWAQLAAEAVQSQLLRLQGPVGRAERLLADAMRSMPADLPDPLRLRLLSWHADLLDRAGKVEPAARRYQEAISLADAMPAPAWQRAELRSSLAKTLHLAGQTDRARVLNQAAFALARQSADDKALALAYRTDGILQLGGPLTESQPAAEQAMRAALEHAQRAGARREEIRATANLADLALRRADYVQALAYAERALPLARAMHDGNAESVALANAGFARIMLGQKSEGLRLARASMAVDERAGEPAEVASTQGELGFYLEKSGHFAEAYAAYSSYRRLNEQVFRSDLQRNLGEMQEAFDHERRQREIDLLERENRFQRAQLVSRQLRQWLWATGAALGALLLGLGALLLRRLRAGNLQLERANAKLAQLSERDALTGLANRRGFQSALPAHTRIEGTLVLLDIDHFKRINDTWGHASGDAVLVEVAQRLRAALREHDLVVRWGGEEFLVWLPAAASGEAETLVACTLAAIGAAPVIHGSDRIPVTASIGFATFPIEPARLALCWEEALVLVDAAMYLAKAHGRNRAYGVRRAGAGSAAALAALAGNFEHAWRHGDVDLQVIAGPAVSAKAPG